MYESPELMFSHFCAPTSKIYFNEQNLMAKPKLLYKVLSL